MKNSYWAYWLIVLGVLIVIVLLLVDNYTTTNTQDYVLIKEITESAMVDAIDYAYYSTYGELKINKEKFYEVFTRRFAEDASLTTRYEISFYDVYEAPPKVGVEVSSKSSTFNFEGSSDTFDIVNKVDAVLEMKGTEKEVLSENDLLNEGELSYNNQKTSSEKLIKNLKNCHAEFNDEVCKTTSKVDITVTKCGTLTDLGVNTYEAKDTKTIYCIAKKNDDNKCSIITTYENMEKNYCN